MQLFNLTSKTALITGSSSGLGLGMARGLAQAGAHIILNSRSPERLVQPTQQLEKEDNLINWYKSSFEINFPLTTSFDNTGFCIDFFKYLSSALEINLFE